MNIKDLLVEKGLSNGCVSFIVEDLTGDVLAVFYSEEPSVAWGAAHDYNLSNYDIIDNTIIQGAEKIGICVGEYNETSDTQYFEV